MARKKRTSVLEDLLEIVSCLPWWVGVAIAILGYLLLQRIAIPAPITSTQPSAMAEALMQSVITGSAKIGQYLVPMIGLLGAAISFFRRKQRSTLLTGVAQAQSVQALDHMSWREFELLVGEAFRLQGYRVSENADNGPDDGIDLTLSKGNETFLVQCKQWKALKVGVNVVRELYGVMAAKGANGGFVVTSGRFTDAATAFAQGRHVQLIDGPKLFAMIQQAKQSLPATNQRFNPRPPAAQQATPKPLVATPNIAAMEPACPQCGAGMIQRTARKGSNAGRKFLGCSKYPTCRGVRQLG